MAPKASPWNLGNILGLLALLATIAFGIIPLIVSSAQQRLRLDATIQSAAQIVGSTLPSQVRVTVGGKEARNVYATVLKVANSGARPITPDLFAPGTVLRLRLGDQCEVVEQRVVGARPQDVRERARVTVIPGGVALAPLLLNPDDRHCGSNGAESRVLGVVHQPSASPGARNFLNFPERVVSSRLK
ncbi:hypothetical protein [Deinococcus grandis]|uniref:hypothetical protein n=1 Tax=Deinococcus grandis TaxID=57498 RepID=UPI00128F943F|nr:hypothetical protein [Deinococcus grandis]